MSVRVVKQRPASSAEWDNVWQRCGYSTYFHSREWAEIWQEHYGGRLQPAARVIVFGDGLTALLVGSSRAGASRVRGRSFVSTPEGCFGGWLSADKLSAAHARSLIGVMARSGHATWRVNPYDPTLADVPLPNAEDDQTHALKLDRDFEEIRRSFNRGLRSRINKAHRSGVTVRRAATPKDWEAYYDVYLDTVTRWGDKAPRNPYPRELFECIRLRGSPNAELMLAEHGGEVVAGSLFFFSPTHVAYWHGATRRDALALSPMNVLHSDAIRAACASGRRWFDFNPSAHLPGVRAYKESFGAVPLDAPFVTFQPRSATARRSLGRAKAALRRRIQGFAPR